MKKFAFAVLLCSLLLCGCDQQNPDRERQTDLATSMPFSYEPATSTPFPYESATSTPISYEEETVGDFLCQVQEDSVKITAYIGKNNTTVVIPEEINGKKVKIIGETAFYQHTEVTAIQLPAGLETIEHAAFYRCYALESIVIPKNVKQIVKTPFFRCSSLTDIVVDPQNETYCAIDGVLFNRDKTELLAYPEGKTEEQYVVPQSVTSIRHEVFGYHTNLKKIEFPPNITIFPEWNIFIFPADITFVVMPNSAAEKYVQKHNLNYETKINWNE